MRTHGWKQHPEPRQHLLWRVWRFQTFTLKRKLECVATSGKRFSLDGLTDLKQHRRHQRRLHGVAELAAEHDGAVHHPALERDSIHGALAGRLLPSFPCSSSSASSSSAGGGGAASRSIRLAGGAPFLLLAARRRAVLGLDPAHHRSHLHGVSLCVLRWHGGAHARSGDNCNEKENRNAKKSEMEKCFLAVAETTYMEVLAVAVELVFTSWK